MQDRRRAYADEVQAAALPELVRQVGTSVHGDPDVVANAIARTRAGQRIKAIALICDCPCETETITEEIEESPQP